MKKKNLAFAVLAFSVSLLFTACRTGGRNVDACDPVLGCNKITIQISGYQDTFLCLRDPKAGDSAFSFIYRRQPDMQVPVRLMNELDFGNALAVNDSALVTLVIYSSRKLKKATNLQQADIGGLLAYYRKGNAMFTEAYAILDDSLVKDVSLSAESRMLSPDDIRDIAGLLVPGHSFQSAIAWIDFGSLPKKVLHASELQNHIGQERDKDKIDHP